MEFLDFREVFRVAECAIIETCDSNYINIAFDNLLYNFSEEVILRIFLQHFVPGSETGSEAGGRRQLSKQIQQAVIMQHKYVSIFLASRNADSIYRYLLATIQDQLLSCKKQAYIKRYVYLYVSLAT